MHVITERAELARQLEGAIRNYKRVSFAVAWASVGFDAYKALLKNKHKIKLAVVGTHFSQTHPDFIAKLYRHPGVRFLGSNDGVFHPKVFLFENSAKEWMCVVGSANFTKAAFNSNVEACAIIRNPDSPNGAVRDQMRELLLLYWDDRRRIDFNPKKLLAYRKSWRARQEKIRSLSINPVLTAESRTRLRLMSMPWTTYVREVRRRDIHTTEDRLEVLKAARDLFRHYKRFAKIPIDGQKGIAGLIDSEDVPWGWFGNMKPARHFKSQVNKRNTHFSLALDAIPQKGPVTRVDYLRYVAEFKRAFARNDEGKRIGHGIGTATRLLAMKRPDYFVCLDNPNNEGICETLGVSWIYHHQYERYWDDVIEPLLESAWWTTPRPPPGLSRGIWNGRMAFLDALFYDA